MYLVSILFYPCCTKNLATWIILDRWFIQFHHISTLIYIHFFLAMGRNFRPTYAICKSIFLASIGYIWLYWSNLSDYKILAILIDIDWYWLILIDIDWLFIIIVLLYASFSDRPAPPGQISCPEPSPVAEIAEIGKTTVVGPSGWKVRDGQGWVDWEMIGTIVSSLLWGGCFCVCWQHESKLFLVIWWTWVEVIWSGKLVIVETFDQGN